MITRKNANQSKQYEDSPLRQWREAKNWTMRKFAENSGIKLGTIAALERGEYMPNTANAAKLTAMLGKDADEIVKKMLDYVYMMQARRNARHSEPRVDWHEWDTMTERRGERVKGLDMRLVNEFDPMKSLKSLRVRARLSTWDAAKRVGIPEYRWAGIERGEEKPDIQTARKIAGLFKTEWVWIRELALK